jgi:hypothetical protein
MNKLLVLLVLAVACVGYAAYLRLRPVETRVCARLADLCGDDRDDSAVTARRGRDAAHCERDLRKLAKAAAPDTMSRLDRCVGGARSCLEGSGCVIGSGVRALGDMFEDLQHGVNASFDD